MMVSNDDALEMNKGLGNGPRKEGCPRLDCLGANSPTFPPRKWFLLYNNGNTSKELTKYQHCSPYHALLDLTL